MHKMPPRVEVIIRLFAPKQPKAPRRAVASGLPSWSRESKSSSNVERDLEMSASCRSVAKLRRTSHDRLRKSSDWNESNPRKVVAVLDEDALEADSSSVLVADPWIDKSSRSSTNLSRSLLEPATGVFGFMSMRNQRKLPAPSATQTHEPKTNVMP
jgi:hypothetical protein